LRNYFYDYFFLAQLSIEGWAFLLLYTIVKKIIIISLLFLYPLFCEEDSTRVYKLADVVVTGTRNPVAVEKLSSTVQIADSMLIAQSNGNSVADVLQSLSGVTLRNYGGNAALQSISIRGMGPDYSLILVNGQRFSTFQINTVDVGIFSLLDVDRIEVAAGGNSSLYGADAVGGVVNIITKKPNAGTMGSISSSVGSFGMNGIQLSVSSGDGQLSVLASLRKERGSNKYNFQYSDGVSKKILERTGADYLLNNYSITVRRMFDTIAVSTLTLRYSNADRGQPDAVTSIYQSNAARVNDKDFFVNMATELKLSNEWIISLPISFYNKYQTYRNPNLVTNGLPLSSFYKNNNFSFAPLFRFSISPEHTLVTGSDVTIASISSNEIIKSRREQMSGFISSQHTFYMPFEIILFPSARYDTFSDTEGELSPKIGINIGVLDQPSLRLRSSYGKNYRVPTFNDLYWINGGNPLLKPERSNNFDVGIIAGISDELFDANIELNYFTIDARNKIVWQPIAGNLWSPKNLQPVSSKGIELSAKTNILKNILMVHFHYNFVEAIKTSRDYPGDGTQNKILTFVPQETSTLIVGSSFQGISVNIIYSFTGYRYQTADNNPRFILPTFDKVDLNLSYNFKVSSMSIRFKAEANNIFNTDYQMISGYPTPLKNYMLTSEVSFY